MRLFHILALSTLLSAPAFAADLGTYRPGSPYHSVIAQGADICENQCAGDAQCRGWNYVKVNPRAPGVCEFNSKPANPIESSISISGEGAGTLAPNISTGPTNTVRVGTAPAASNTVRVGTSSRSIQRPTIRQASPTRRVVRQPVPQHIRPDQTALRRSVQGIPAHNGSLTAQQNRHRQATGHVAARPHLPNHIQQQAIRAQNGAVQPRLMRDPRILNQRAIQQRAINQRTGLAPQFRHNLDGAHHPGAYQQNPNALRNPHAAQQQGRPPIGVPISGEGQPISPQASAPAIMLQGSVNDPVTYQNAPARIRDAEIAAVQRAAEAQAQAQQTQAQYLSVEQAQQSLFGSLNDDVKAPRPLVNLPADPNAPIATSQSRPTIPVSQEPLGVLAGG